MANVAYNTAVAETFDSVSSVDSDALSHSGSNNYVLSALHWDDGFGDLSTLKYGGPSGTDLDLIPGTSKDQSGAAGARPMKGRLYGKALGSTGDNKVYATFDASARGSINCVSCHDTQGPRASSGFNQGNSQTYESGGGNRTISLTATGIVSGTEDMLFYFGTAIAYSVGSQSSSTGTQCADTGSGPDRSVSYRELNDDGSSESANIQFLSTQYFSGSVWYKPAMTAVMVGVSMQAVGGGITLTAQNTSQSQTSQNVALTQANTLAAQNTSQTQTSQNVALELPGGGVTLTAQNTSQSQTSQNVALTQANVLAAQNTSQAQTSQNVSLTLPGQTLSNPQVTMTYDGFSSLSIDVDV